MNYTILHHANKLKTIGSSQNIDFTQALLIGTHILAIVGKKSKSPIKQAHKIIHEGVKSLEAQKQTVQFSRAVEETLKTKAHRRKRTLDEIRYIANSFMSKTPRLAKRRIRNISSNECSNMIEQCFSTPRQRYKARLILHGIFAVALRRGWCHDNPVNRVDTPFLKEKPIKSLNIKQVQKLIQTAKTEAGGECLAATALMLYAGVRPQEVQRLRWHNINLQEGFIHIHATHSKTGGSRHITIHNKLKRLLEQIPHPSAETKICPSNWEKKWSQVRKSAGWNSHDNPWVQDCLRHSFASFHARYFKNFTRLQYEMGHSNSSLLRTRYLNMDGLDQKSARNFWI